jgi:hypothetical protein
MVWRYHPQRQEYEIFATGGGNVFGLDVRQRGAALLGHNGGDTRGWHYVAGGTFLQQAVDPGKSGRRGMLFLRAIWTHEEPSPVPRFSHATIVFGGTHFRESYRDRFLGAIRCSGTSSWTERYTRGSTFETSDSGVALVGADPAFRPVFMTNAPDGAVYSRTSTKSTSRTGKIIRGSSIPPPGGSTACAAKDAALNRDVNLQAKSSAELMELLRIRTGGIAITAVRLLSERRESATVEPLRQALASRDQTSRSRRSGPCISWRTPRY